jgi:hypothetical protein
MRTVYFNYCTAAGYVLASFLPFFPTLLGKIYGYNMDGKLINLPDWLIYSPFFLPGFGNVADIQGQSTAGPNIGFGWM